MKKRTAEKRPRKAHFKFEFYIGRPTRASDELLDKYLESQSYFLRLGSFSAKRRSNSRSPTLIFANNPHSLLRKRASFPALPHSSEPFPLRFSGYACGC